MGHAGFDAALKRRDRALAVAAVKIPGSLPDHGDRRAVLAEWILSHDCRLVQEIFPKTSLDEHNANVLPACHHPRKRVIQYPETALKGPKGRSVLDRPVKPGDDSLGVVT